MQKKFFRTLLITLTLLSTTNAAISAPPPLNADGVEHQRLARGAARDDNEEDALNNSTAVIREGTSLPESWWTTESGDWHRKLRNYSALFLVGGMILFIIGLVRMGKTGDSDESYRSFIRTMLSSCQNALIQCCPRTNPPTMAND